MNKTLQFYNYEQCFAHYTKRIINVRQAKIHGEVIVAKPVLILTIIEGIEAEFFIKNEFQLTDWLEKQYLELMKKYMRESQFEKPTDINNPYWHLQSDGFWHLHHKTAVADGSTPTKRWLKEHVDFAYFDDDLWILLQNKVWRMKLRDYIVEHKLSDDHWLGKTAAESLWAIAALLMVA